VDIEAGDRAVELFKKSVAKTHRPEVLGGIGGFAGLFALKGGYREPVLAASTDGVGTKIAVAQAMDKRDTVGLDLVAMVVDDLVVCGAEPLFLQDYIAADRVLGPDRVRPGDVVIAMRSSGLHSNGYSLARHVLLEIDRMDLFGQVEEFGRTLGEELLEPTRIYAKDCLALAAETEVRTFCHVTGGGLAGNLARVIPDGLVAELDRGSWTPGPIFAMIAQRGRIERAEMEKTFNMGVGMVAVVAPEDVDRALAVLTARHIDCWTLGAIKKKSGKDSGSESVLVVRPAVAGAVVIRLRYRSAGKFTAELLEIRVRRAVFQLASNLGLLCLCPAAAHGGTPSRNSGAAQFQGGS
ncbi:Phosphoribosylformylglycinamidine cyclo-ligase like protein, partial [Aduncisulcus paluster]